MDGTRGTVQVIAKTGKSRPDVPDETIRAAASQLIRSGYVEDAAAADPLELSDRDKERYDWARGYYRWLDVTARADMWELSVLTMVRPCA